MQIHCSEASASRPVTTYLEKEVWSNTATAERVARCSAADHGSHDGLPHEYSSTAGVPSGAKTFGRSQPIFEPSTAPLSARRACSGEQRSGRADSSSRLGHGTP